MSQPSGAPPKTISSGTNPFAIGNQTFGVKVPAPKGFGPFKSSLSPAAETSPAPSQPSPAAAFSFSSSAAAPAPFSSSGFGAAPLAKTSTTGVVGEGPAAPSASPPLQGGGGGGGGETAFGSASKASASFGGTNAFGGGAALTQQSISATASPSPNRPNSGADKDVMCPNNALIPKPTNDVNATIGSGKSQSPPLASFGSQKALTSTSPPRAGNAEQARSALSSERSLPPTAASMRSEPPTSIANSSNKVVADREVEEKTKSRSAGKEKPSTVGEKDEGTKKRKAAVNRTVPAKREQRFGVDTAELRRSRGLRWSADAAAAAHATNVQQLRMLCELVALSRSCTDACTLEAELSLERHALKQFEPIIGELTNVIHDAEKLAADLKNRHAFLSPASGAVCGEDGALLKAWATKEGAFVDMFVRHRDRFLKIQREDTMRSLAELTRDTLLRAASEQRCGAAFANNDVAREYLRPDI